jgi:hypothetical protein
MRWLGHALVLVTAVCAAPPAVAQERLLREKTMQMLANASGSLTGKERLGRKWMDEQRIDNCNVPPDKRGNKPRAATCRPGPSG